MKPERETRFKVVFVVARPSAPTNTMLISFLRRLEPDCPRGMLVGKRKAT